MQKNKGIRVDLSKNIHASITIFSVGYWFIWNSPFKFIPKLAGPAIGFIRWLNQWLGTNVELCSDCGGQWIALLLLLILSTILGYLKPTVVQNTLAWGPLLLVAGQLLIYGSSKIGGHQFGFFLLNPSDVVHPEISFWHSLSDNTSLAIALGIVQVVLAVGLFIKPISFLAKCGSTLTFLTILVLDLIYKIPVITHVGILLLMSVYLLLRTNKTRISGIGAFLLSLCCVSLLVESLFLLGVLN